MKCETGDLTEEKSVMMVCVVSFKLFIKGRLQNHFLTKSITVSRQVSTLRDTSSYPRRRRRKRRGMRRWGTSMDMFLRGIFSSPSQ